VISNQEFTDAAKKLAFTHNCQLIGRRTLLSWVPPPARRAV
jgi:restriction system protein